MTAPKDVLLGFEVGTAKPVRIPLRHMVVTGQTQEAGKTTTLEALIERSGVKAVVFVTKRGEGSFGRARTIQPYFKEHADWKYVAAILEASRGEKLKFERSWIIRASKGARTLADVQRNVRKAMETAKGLSADVYLTLDAYLDEVVPEISKVRWATTVDLAPGVSAMDLSRISESMQHLVIRSTLDYVLSQESDSVVVIPEAWKFIPQGRGTPVKLAAEAYIRQAAGLRNYLWLDSQDIAGVEKMILKSVPVWVLGVQRESNEVKRTLDQIPAGLKKPKLEAVATLGLGQFFACWGTEIRKVYVQPAWMNVEDAQRVARGTSSAEGMAAATKLLDSIEEDDVKPEEAQRLRDDNARLAEENHQLGEKVADLEARIEGFLHQLGRRNAEDVAPPERIRQAVGSRVEPLGTAELPKEFDAEKLYQAFKLRLLAEAPSILKVALARPELVVAVKREVVSYAGDGWIGRVALLIREGFFSSPKKSGEVFKELYRRGASGIPARADEACKSLVAKGFLTREETGFQAVDGMKSNIVKEEA